MGKIQIQTCAMSHHSKKAVSRKMPKVSAVYKIKVMKIKKMSKMRWSLIRKNLMLKRGDVLFFLAKNRI
jgi:hypothetical protein